MGKGLTSRLEFINWVLELTKKREESWVHSLGGDQRCLPHSKVPWELLTP